MNKIVVTANFGDYDNPVKIHHSNPGWEFLMFTDREIKSKLWKVIKTDKGFATSRRRARYYKWMIHELANAKYSLWIDANIKILVDLDGLISEYLSDSDIALYKHRLRNCLYKEAWICKKSRLDKKEIIERQVGRYEQEGYPPDNGLDETTIILRRHTPQIIKLNEAIWNEISIGSIRDQIAFNYCVWKLGINVNNFPGMIKLYPKARKVLEKYFGKIKYVDPYFKMKEHKNKN